MGVHGSVKRKWKAGGYTRRLFGLVCCVLVAGCAEMTLAAGSEGLVGFWRFDEGSGATARDSSGEKNHGTITGATFVKDGKGYSLRFDGESGFVDIPASPRLNIGSAGTISLWFKPEERQGGLIKWGVGNIAFDTRTTYGTPQNDLILWMGYSGSDCHSQPIALPRQGGWNHITLTIDGRRVVFYRDGAPETVVSLAVDYRRKRDYNLVIGRQGGRGKQFFKGLIDEVRIYNRPLSDTEVLSVYRQSATAFGADMSLFKRPRLKMELLPDPGRIVVRARCALMSPLPKGAVMDVSVGGTGAGASVPSVKQQIRPGDRETILNLDATQLPAGKYQVNLSLRRANGEQFGHSSTASIDWPGQTKVFRNVKVLNNLVWELLNETPGRVNGVRQYSFTQPKRRWVYVACVFAAAGGKVSISIDDAVKTRDIIVVEGAEETRQETMRFLPAGEHVLTIRAQGARSIKHVVVRSIPEIVFATLLPKPHTAPHGPYDAAFMKKYVVPHVNTFVISNTERDPRTETPLFKELKQRGYRIVAHCNVPKKMDGKPITVEQAYAYLAGTLGMTHPDLDGVMADEYGLGGPHCATWAKAVRKILAGPTYSGKIYYPYVGRMTRDPDSRELIKTLMDMGSPFAFKRYIKVRHTEEAAHDYLRHQLIQYAREFHRRCPGSMENLTVCFGYFSAPDEFLNVVPQVNYKTYLDMQFNLVANAPEYWGAYGLMSYLAHYADEETIRWIARLGRHYGIEGNTERASADPYDSSRHLANGDFDLGNRPWKLSPAAPKSIRQVSQTQLGWLQGRYPAGSQGDTALLMVRSAKAPNSFSQEIKNLDPGRTYTFRMITGQYRDLTKEEKHAVRVKLDGVEVIPESSFSHVFHNNYSHNYKQYDARRTKPGGPLRNPAWMNYHWILFRAKSATATATVSDWASEADPGGPIGQELMFNFLQVHPYLER